ncbi:hypothetical protein M011DRAFT_293665 [Sporormia fimetaria CBS 119925]|uniref:Uncharacterized protein n=1 Tax=Sporormia fimetaria CBS 119925 TaxID=1340428 RepID=A0A6A6UXC5_9PLEO|nr:hypothetical protein M011DRAFT_293665 [Sporormia fimetaria CBS 119925]
MVRIFSWCSHVHSPSTPWPPICPFPITFKRLLHHPILCLCRLRPSWVFSLKCTGIQTFRLLPNHSLRSVDLTASVTTFFYYSGPYTYISPTPNPWAGSMFVCSVTIEIVEPAVFADFCSSSNSPTLILSSFMQHPSPCFLLPLSFSHSTTR